jgi:2-hydroxychromene-2-carboxylate isomerase
MRAATYAKQAGRTVAFTLAAFRQAFAAGRDLSEPENVLIAAAACELHPNAVLKAIETDSVKSALREATDAAGDLGVRGVPSLVVGEEVFWGDDRLTEALEAAS